MTANAKQHPILPISNMNFTGNMNGWTTSRSYSPVADSGTVENSPQNVSINSEGCPSPPSGAECFQPSCAERQHTRLPILDSQNLAPR